MIKRSIKNILSSIIGEVNKAVYFFTKHILNRVTQNDVILRVKNSNS